LAAGGGAPTLKLTWDFSDNDTTSTTEFTVAQLKTFLELYDTPSYSYTISPAPALAKVFKGSGTTDSPNYHYDCLKFSSSSVGGKFTASGLPSYTYVKIWVARWSTEASTLQVNGGTAQSITTNNYDLYTFDGFNAQTSFSVLAVKRSMINKIEFWGC
jgi:hypothetical protein